MSAFHHTVRTVTPFHDRSRSSRLVKIALWLLGTAVVLALCHLAGFDVLGWFESVWDTMKEISIQYVVAGLFFQTIQTTLTALAWYFILAAGYPDGGVRYRDILAAYAVGVAMNGFLPANIGTFASLLMYMALIRGATFPGILGAMTVQKIFYTVIGVFVYLYLFISVPGTFNLQLGVVDNHRLLIPLLIVAAVVATYLLIRPLLGPDQGPLGEGEAGGSDPGSPPGLRRQGPAAVVRLVGCEADRHCHLSRCLQHPRDLPHGDVGRGRHSSRTPSRSHPAVSASPRR